MKLLYRFHTRIGTFYIGEREGRFHPIYDDQSLGSYAHLGKPQKMWQGVTRSRSHQELILELWAFLKIFVSGRRSLRDE